jgi:hypothetical protein
MYNNDSIAKQMGFGEAIGSFLADPSYSQWRAMVLMEENLLPRT